MTIVNNTVNDCAMTVLPDAPIDAATGLPVPTIAVATDGGTSVIADSGAVYDSSRTETHSFLSFVDEGLWFGRDTVMNFATYVDILAGDGFGDIRASTGDHVASRARLITRARTDFIAFENDFAACGDVAPIGLQRSNINYDVFGNTMANFITSTYNTGWMPGDIKGAFLSDTDDTDLVGSGELVTNGDFATDSDWTKGTGWTISGGVASSDGTQSASSQLLQTSAFTSGKQYVLNFDLTSISAGNIFVSVGGGSFGPITTAGTYSLTLTATGSNDLFIQAGSTFVGSVDNISVKLADADRSVNNKGLIVNGTVTKNPVATGADLVAYSGFSSSNYFSQPYNSDLDFGTGDFCVMGWVKTSSTSDGALFHRALDNSDGGIYFRMTGGKLFVYLSNSTTYNLALSGTVSINTGSWVFVAVSRKGGVAYLHVSGSLDVSAANVADLTYAGAISRFGVRTLGTAALTGSLALWRISATAPTAEQISRIYNDEKVLFQENAQATLYGSSDAVTALAYDDATNLLHVGTSAGRSVFQGLRRVDNTTTAVGTAISASNGLIAEE